MSFKCLDTEERKCASSYVYQGQIGEDVIKEV